jgi:hypothetical protein
MSALLFVLNPGKLKSSLKMILLSMLQVFLKSKSKCMANLQICYKYQMYLYGLITIN